MVYLIIGILDPPFTLQLQRASEELLNVVTLLYCWSLFGHSTLLSDFPNSSNAFRIFGGLSSLLFVGYLALVGYFQVTSTKSSKRLDKSE